MRRRVARSCQSRAQEGDGRKYLLRPVATGKERQRPLCTVISEKKPIGAQSFSAKDARRIPAFAWLAIAPAVTSAETYAKEARIKGEARNHGIY